MYILMSATSLGFASNLFMPSTVLLTNQMGETNQVCLGLSGLRRKPTKDNLAESRSFIIHIVCIVCWVKTSRLGLFLQVVVPSHHIHHKRSQLMLSSAWQPFYLTKHCKRHNRSKGCVLSPKQLFSSHVTIWSNFSLISPKKAWIDLKFCVSCQPVLQISKENKTEL